MYINETEYAELYPSMDSKDFKRLSFEAEQHIDRLTTGADGVKKLKVAFPTDTDSAAAVKHCAAKIINILFQIQEAEKSASMGRGYEQTANGLQGKVVSSVSSGNESISYTTGNASKTVIDMAVADISVKNRIVRDTVSTMLSGVSDANGVNLLYMGVYPRV